MEKGKNRQGRKEREESTWKNNGDFILIKKRM